VRAPTTQPPRISTPVPGPRSRALAERLSAVESRNVTCAAPAPIFWERAAGANVWDVDGNRYVDLCAGFGVANVGHAHPLVVKAVADQTARLLHGMGDVQPPDVKVALLEALAARYPGGAPAKVVLGSSGSDAVEAALKTAQIATGRAGVVAFEGAYHGVSMGALEVTHRPFFREPFSERVVGLASFARFGDLEDVARAARDASHPVGAVLVEPVQGRGGEHVAPPGFLRGLRELCDRNGWLLIADEIYTGFGRTGRWFACEHEGVVPDLLCLGKGMASGMPISACAGRAEVMDAWPLSTGEAIHTQTFLGHPPSCAAALASMLALEEEKLVDEALALGEHARARLANELADRDTVREVRGLGLMLGVECDTPERAASATAEALSRGLIVLPSGSEGQVRSLTPPLCIGREALDAALDLLMDCIP
jgi:4-aminobutyrate aminotransferase/(S)-3-amino-2-methylpropionate transaminase